MTNRIDLNSLELDPELTLELIIRILLQKYNVEREDEDALLSIISGNGGNQSKAYGAYCTLILEENDPLFPLRDEIQDLIDAIITEVTRLWETHTVELVGAI